MAVIINTIDESTFSLNGINYSKIYQPLIQGTTDVSLRNAFDTNFLLLSGTHYSEFTVDSNTFASQALLIAALIPVVYNNLGDGDDVIISSGVLEFKDRSNYFHIPQGFDWTQDLSSYAGSTMEVRYPVDLGTGTCTLPAGVILKFKGGSFNNGTLALNETTIKAGEEVIFGSSLTQSGGMRNGHALAIWYGAIGGGADFTTEIQKALDNNTEVHLHRSIFKAEGVTLTDNKLVGNGATVRPNGGSDSMFDLTSNSEVYGVHIDATASACLYGFEVGDNSTVQDCTFDGDFGHCIIVDNATNVKIIGNRLLIGTYEQTIAIVIQYSESVTVQGNILEEHSGFGIQARFSSGVSYIGNVITQRVFTDTFSTTSTSQTFNLTTTRKIRRFAVLNDGNWIVPSITENSETDYDYACTGLTIGQDTTVYGFVGLEQLQVNSGCDGVTIVGNVLNTTGDSNIVVGADYHWTGSVWELVPANVVLSDYPKNVTIADNVIKGKSYASGIALNNAVNGIVKGNVISDVGYHEDIAFKVGIIIGSVCEGSIIRDNITNNVNGWTVACVSFIGNSAEDYSGQATNVMAFNKGVGCKNYEFYADSDSTKRRIGYNVLDARVDDLVTRRLEAMLDGGYTSGTFSDAYLNVTISGGTGMTSTSKGYASPKSFGTKAGEYANIYLQSNVKNIYKERLVRIEFWALADAASDAGHLRVYYDPATDDAEPNQQISLSGTTWTYHQMTIAVESLDNFFIRLTGTTGVINISRLRVDILDIN